jgi:Ca2+-binding RTX toxin-like protein
MNDWIVGGAGDDTLDGGAGNDTYAFGGNTNLGTDTIEEAANADTDTLNFMFLSYGLTVDLTKFGTGNYAVNSANLKLQLANNTAIEDVYGTGYKDTLIGNSRDNKLHGRNGNDIIRGNAGFDYLYGGAHNDRFYTDAFDQVFGEAGTDTFDGVTENSYSWMNPRPYNYLDWGVF